MMLMVMMIKQWPSPTQRNEDQRILSPLQLPAVFRNFLHLSSSTQNSKKYCAAKKCDFNVISRGFANSGTFWHKKNILWTENAVMWKLWSVLASFRFVLVQPRMLLLRRYQFSGPCEACHLLFLIIIMFAILFAMMVLNCDGHCGNYNLSTRYSPILIDSSEKCGSGF